MLPCVSLGMVRWMIHCSVIPHMAAFDIWWSPLCFRVCCRQCNYQRDHLCWHGDQDPCTSLVPPWSTTPGILGTSLVGCSPLALHVNSAEPSDKLLCQQLLPLLKCDSWQEILVLLSRMEVMLRGGYILPVLMLRFLAAMGWTHVLSHYICFLCLVMG